MASYNVCSWGKVNCSGSKLKPIGAACRLLFKDGQRIVYHLVMVENQVRKLGYLGPSSVMAFQDLGAEIIHIHQGIVSYGDNPFP